MPSRPQSSEEQRACTAGENGAIRKNWRKGSLRGCAGWTPTEPQSSCAQCPQGLGLRWPFGTGWPRRPDNKIPAGLPAGILNAQASTGCSQKLQLLLLVFAGLVQVLDAGLVDQRASGRLRWTGSGGPDRGAANLDRVSVIPLNDALDALAVFQHQDHRGLRLHLLLEVKGLGVRDLLAGLRRLRAGVPLQERLLAAGETPLAESPVRQLGADEFPGTDNVKLARLRRRSCGFCGSRGRRGYRLGDNGTEGGRSSFERILWGAKRTHRRG